MSSLQNRSGLAAPGITTRFVAGVSDRRSPPSGNDSQSAPARHCERLSIESRMGTISLRVNGRLHTVNADPTTPLLFVLADDLGLRGPKFGCGMAQCGACSVLVDGEVARSCVMDVSAVGEREVVTLEGLGTSEKADPIQQCFIEEGAAQCGFCLSGVILTVKAVLDQKPNATEQDVRDALGGVLCRCFSHVRMWRALRKYVAMRRS